MYNLCAQAIINEGREFRRPANDNISTSCDARDTESGMLLIDRADHLDVLEYLLWVNRYARPPAVDLLLD